MKAKIQPVSDDSSAAAKVDGTLSDSVAPILTYETVETLIAGRHNAGGIFIDISSASKRTIDHLKVRLSKIGGLKVFTGLDYRKAIKGGIKDGKFRKFLTQFDEVIRPKQTVALYDIDVLLTENCHLGNKRVFEQIRKYDGQNGDLGHAGGIIFLTERSKLEIESIVKKSLTATFYRLDDEETPELVPDMPTQRQRRIEKVQDILDKTAEDERAGAIVDFFENYPNNSREAMNIDLPAEAPVVYQNVLVNGDALSFYAHHYTEWHGYMMQSELKSIDKVLYSALQNSARTDGADFEVSDYFMPPLKKVKTASVLKAAKENRREKGRERQKKHRDRKTYG